VELLASFAQSHSLVAFNAHQKLLALLAMEDQTSIRLQILKVNVFVKIGFTLMLIFAHHALLSRVVCPAQVLRLVLHVMQLLTLSLMI